MIMSAASTKRQMKEAAGSFNVSSTSLDEVDDVVQLTLNSMAEETVFLLKRKKTATELILEDVALGYLKAGVAGVFAKSPIVRAYKDMMDQYGEERPYRMTKEAEEWISNFVTDLVFTLAYKGKKEAEADGKRTIQPSHIRLAHRDILIENM